jgi:hypothetical protein
MDNMPAPRHIIEFTDTDEPTAHDIYPIAVPCRLDEITDEKAEAYARKVCAELHADGAWPDPDTLRVLRRVEN